MRRRTSNLQFYFKNIWKTRLYDSLNVSFELNQKFCKEATKSKFPDIVDEGESGMNINNILSDFGFAQYPTGINNIICNFILYYTKIWTLNSQKIILKEISDS